MVNEKNKGRLIIVSGAAGSGKGTVLNELLAGTLETKNKYKYSVSATTRLPRAGEVHGVNYFFVSDEEFMSMRDNGELLEYVEYSGNMYGTPKRRVEETLDGGFCVVLEIEVFGAMNVKRANPDAILIFIAPPTFSQLKDRLRGRATEPPEVIQRRLDISREEIKHINNYDYFLVNETGKATETAEIIDDIVYAERIGDNSLQNYRVSDDRICLFLDNYYNEHKT